MKIFTEEVKAEQEKKKQQKSAAEAKLKHKVQRLERDMKELNDYIWVRCFLRRGVFHGLVRFHASVPANRVFISILLFHHIFLITR
jgi:hypothetical protein